MPQRWPRTKRVRVLVAVIVLLLLAGAWFGFRTALRHEPSFYARAVALAPAEQAAESDAFLQRASTLASELQTEDRWTALFTADEINGWLAVDVPKNWNDALPPGVTEPRVMLRPGGGAIACRYRDAYVETVAWIEFELQLVEPNVVALRLVRARLGAVPLPLGKFLEPIAEAARRTGCQLRWADRDGAPEALLALPPDGLVDDRRSTIEKLECLDGELYLAGTSAPVAATDP
jgi:hypothetical protein